MAFDFPAAPAVDQIYTDAVSGLSYVFDGVMWKQGTTTSGPVGDAWVLKVGDTMTGALVLPDPDPVSPLHSTHKRYVDTTIATNALYQGVWQVAANVPDLNVPPNAPLNGYSWLAQTVDPGTPEIAAATIPGIGGSSIAALDTVKWNAVTLEYDHIRGAVGISQMTIADAPPATGFHGQCWWDSDSGKQYVYYDDGTSQAWVQMSGGGGGQASVTVSASAPTAPTKGMLWYDTTTGELNVYYDDGTTQQWVQCNVEEAPVDGQNYVRNNAAWAVGGAGGGLADAPADGSEYLRKDNAWVNPTAAAGAFLPLDGSEAMTGPLTVSAQHPAIMLRSTDAAGFPSLGVYINNIQPTWSFDFNDIANTGNLFLGRSPGAVPAAGSMVNALTVDRQTGIFDFKANPTVNGVPLGGGASGAFVPLDGSLDMTGGLGFGSQAQTAVDDLSRHLALYGTTFGFNVTSGTLNYVVPSANFHIFRHGATQTMKIASGAIDFNTHMNIGTAAALRNTSLHGYLLVTDDQQLYLDGVGTKNTGSKGILFRKSATESAILHGRICSRWDDYSQGIIDFQLNNQAGGVVSSVTFNGGVSLERWAWFNAMSVQCADVVETSTAADKTEIRDVQKAEVETAWKTLKPKKFRRKSTEDNSVGPLRYGFVMEDMADELTKKRPPSPQGNASGYSIGQVLALTVAKLKEVEAELAALKAKVK